MVKQSPRIPRDGLDTFTALCLIGNEFFARQFGAMPGAGAGEPGALVSGVSTVLALEIDAYPQQAEQLWTESDSQEEGGGLGLETHRGIELRQWAKDTKVVSLYAVKGSRYGLVACNEIRRAHFNYQLLYHDKRIRLESTAVAWDMSQESLIRGFNALCVGCDGDQLRDVVVLWTPTASWTSRV